MRRGWPVSVVVALALATPAHAQPATVPVVATRESPAPWSAGVSDDQKTRALASLKEGNTLFDDKAYPEALERFTAALDEWDHPAIRYNVARALIQLGRPVEAYDHLTRALAYGPAALDPDVYAEALSYRALLDGQISAITVTCDEAGVRVTLDGRFLVTCPGQASRPVAPGTHQVVAARPGQLASTRDVLALARNPVTVYVEPMRPEDVAVVTRRWPAWKPWAVVAVGAALGGVVGTYFLWQADVRMREFDEAIAVACRSMSCDPANLDPSIRSLRAQADRDTEMAFGAFGVGGAVVAAGLVGVVLNLPRRELPADFQFGAFAITPALGGGSMRLTVQF